MWLLSLLRLLLAVLSLRGNRWAYIAFMVLGLLYFPMSVGFHFNPQPCELTPSLSLMIFSLTNYAHITLFALCYVITSAQFQKHNWSAFAWTILITIVMGALVEVAQGVTGKGHCRLRDLIPDTAGALLGAVIVLLLRKIGWRLNPGWSLMRWRGRTFNNSFK
ncbi:MAG: VanZ family protein [Acidobacteriota bacterium]